MAEKINKYIVSKYIDDFNFGILKSEVSNLEDLNILEHQVSLGFLYKIGDNYLLSQTGFYGLQLGKKTSKELLKLRFSRTKVWSFSELEMYNMCPLRYKLTKIDKLPQRINAYGVYGGFTHEILEKYYQGFFNNVNFTPYDLFEKGIKRLEMLGLTLPSEIIQENYKNNMFDFFKSISNIKYNDFKSNRLETEVLYKFFDTEWITGYIDLIEIVSYDKENKIHHVNVMDFKTSTMYDENSIDEYANQLLLYAYMLEKLYPNIKVDNIGWKFLKYCKITIGNKTKINERINKYVGFKVQLKKVLNGDGDSAEQIILNNLIPDDIKHNIKEEECIIYYPYNLEKVNNLLNFIKNTINNININKDNPYNSCNILDSEYFCKNLCGVYDFCDNFKESQYNKMSMITDNAILNFEHELNKIIKE